MPIVLGLTGVIPEDVAVFTAIALEIIVFPLARLTLVRLEAAHYARRPA